LSSASDALAVRGLTIAFKTDAGYQTAVDGISFDLGRGETLALVGESGCGKSVTALAILRLIPDPPGRVTAGEIVFKGRNLLALPEREMRKVRGSGIAMVFQEPTTSLNPVFTVGEQIAEVIRTHEGAGRAEARRRAIEAMGRVRIPDPEARYGSYPHQLSGGMRQRVMIAMALAGRPDVLVADEPTTALDVTIQAQILALIAELQKELGMSVLLISHDLSVVRETAERTAVMYAGAILETAPTEALLAKPLHPYTQALRRAVPSAAAGPRLPTIPGRVPPLGAVPPYCRFYDRCPLAAPECREREPELRELGPGRFVRCVKA
jgi:oligopeptide/dipeptide ABC transporter ATP-binding protein